MANRRSSAWVALINMRFMAFSIHSKHHRPKGTNDAEANA
jgi:hypothetical protein